MQHTNDDMDDLLRDAAENYPLKISGANWDAISGRLDGVEDNKKPAAVVPFARENKRYRYLLLALLLPVVFFTAKYTGLMGGGSKPAQQTSADGVAGTTQSSLSQAAGDKKDDKKDIQAQSNAALLTAPGGNNPSTGVAGATRQAIARGNDGSIKTRVAAIDGQKLPAENTKAQVPGLKDLGDLEAARNAGNTNIVKGRDANQNNLGIVPKPANGIDAGVSNLPPTEPKAQNNVSGASDEKTGNAATKEDGGDKKGTAAVPPGGKKEKEPRMARFYIGSFVAPDYTTVKYQPGSKIGFTFGGVVGYSLSSRFDVELGISAGKKYYTTNGKYFNTKISWINNWGKVLELSGYAGLTEFPLDVKYNFKPGKDGRFFVAAGILSSIVHQENYKYTLDSSNIIYTRDKSTRISTNNFFSNVNISGGYESDLGSSCSFRIEPYYRIPIKGIGIGGLPITSFGLNIGIIKKFK